MTLLRILKDKRAYPLTKLIIRTIEDASTDNVVILKLNLNKFITKTGSVPYTDGKPITYNSDSVYIVKDDCHRIRFCKIRRGVIMAKTDLNFDVSRPKGRMIEGKWVAIANPKIWLVKRPFVNSSFRIHSERLGDLYNRMFGTDENK